ncbi:IS30 family transposase [Mycoplasmatota bacterium]|nr:IS30 family transposase [Mycoplasmatota bacterium]
MSYKHITINELTNIEANYRLGIKARECALRMQIGKDKVYTYYKLFIQGLTVIQIYNQYQENRKRCGRKHIKLSEEKLKEIDYRLDSDWSLDAIAGRDKVDQVEERCSTKTLYNMVKRDLIDKNKLRRKGKRNPKGHNETRGKINVCKTIHERNEKYPMSSSNEEYGHFEGDTIVGEKRKSAIVTLVEKQTKYIILLKASRKSEDVKLATCNWLNELPNNCIITITFDRGKEFSKWKEIEQESLVDVGIYFGDPGSPGQRGLNENSNGIVRKDLPKSTILSVYTQEELNLIANKWNSIPRKSLNYLTPAKVLNKTTGVDTLLTVA